MFDREIRIDAGRLVVPVEPSKSKRAKAGL